jgi:hypothetical protein
MKLFNRIALFLCLASALAFGQVNTLTQTALSGAISSTQQNFQINSVTNILASLTTSTLIYVDKEAMLVLSVGSPTATSITVARSQNGTGAAAHISGAMVLAGRPDWFMSGDPSGACTLASTYVTPWLNVSNGRQWLCSSITNAWVPGFGNTSAPAGVTTLVASAAGQVTPSGPLFHINGTAAITGFLYPIGMNVGQLGGSFCVVPDAIFTWTAANNIAVLGSAVVNRTLCFTWDATNSKWNPSYVS